MSTKIINNGRRKILPAFVVLLIYVILLSHIFNIAGWNFSKGPIILDIYSLLFALFSLFGYVNTLASNRRDIFVPLFFFLTFSPFLTILIKQFYTYESIHPEIQQTFIMSLAFFTYFFIKGCRLSEKECIAILFCFSLCTFFIQSWQLLNPLDRVFGYNEDGGSGNRNGISRLYIGSPLVMMFMAYYCWQRIIVLTLKSKIIYILLFAIFIISIYLTLTRQLLVATFLTLFISIFLFKKTNTKISVIFFLLMMVGVGVFYYQELFADLVNLSETDSYSTEIRMEALPFFIREIFADPFLFLFGHGHTEEMVRISNQKGYWAVDLGIIGEVYHYGILWGAAYFWVLFIFFKKRKKLPLYIKLFALSSFIHSPMIASYVTGLNAFLWSTCIYIAFLHINNSKLALYEKE